jgi:hypothetical protein
MYQKCLVSGSSSRVILRPNMPCLTGVLRNMVSGYRHPPGMGQVARLLPCPAAKPPFLTPPPLSIVMLLSPAQTLKILPKASESNATHPQYRPGTVGDQSPPRRPRHSTATGSLFTRVQAGSAEPQQASPRLVSCQGFFFCQPVSVEF